MKSLPGSVLLVVLLISFPLGLGCTASDDLKSEEVLDARQLFTLLGQWRSGQVGVEDLFESAQHWYQTISGTPTPTVSSETPVPTPTSGGRVLSLPQQFPVQISLSEFFLVPLHLSDVNGVQSLEFRFPYLVTETDDYSVVVTDFSLSSLTEDWTLENQFGVSGQNVFWEVSLTGDQPLSQTGPGDLLSISVSVVPQGQEPYPTGDEIPFDFLPGTVTMSGAGNTSLEHTVQNGSLLIGSAPAFTATFTPTTSSETPVPTPTGSAVVETSPTPTETSPGVVGTPTPIPTATPTQSSAEAQALRFLACEQQGYAGGFIEVVVDVIDDQGRVINPGMPDGSAPLNVTLSVSGSAYFEDWQGGAWDDLGKSNDALKNQFQTILLNDPEGASITVYNTVAETVTLNAESDGLTATPVDLTFLPSGTITGTIMINQGGSYRPPLMYEFPDINLFEQGTNQYVTTGDEVFEEDGSYSVGGIPPGNYDVRIGLVMAAAEGYQTVCHPGINVLSGQVVSGINANLDPLIGGSRVYGKVSTSDGSNLEYTMLAMGPPDGETCQSRSFITGIHLDQPANEVDYEIKHVAPNEYRFYASGSVDDELYLSRFETVNVAGGSDLNFDIVLYPNYHPKPIAPVGYQRVSGTPVFSWQAPDSPPASYTLAVVDRCFNQVWQVEGITGTQIEYAGPALSNQKVYHWTVRGSDDLFPVWFGFGEDEEETNQPVFTIE